MYLNTCKQQHLYQAGTLTTKLQGNWHCLSLTWQYREQDTQTYCTDIQKKQKQFPATFIFLEFSSFEITVKNRFFQNKYDRSTNFKASSTKRKWHIYFYHTFLKKSYCYCKWCIPKICMIINNILISDTKERLFSTVDVIKLNYPVMLTKESPQNVGRYASGTIYYVHICPQGRILSSSVIKRLNVFLRKKVQTLPTNHGAKYVSLSARHCLLLRLCPRDNFLLFSELKGKSRLSFPD